VGVWKPQSVRSESMPPKRRAGAVRKSTDSKRVKQIRDTAAVAKRLADDRTRAFAAAEAANEHGVANKKVCCGFGWRIFAWYLMCLCVGVSVGTRWSA
jgi:hypothetical protein